MVEIVLNSIIVMSMIIISAVTALARVQSPIEAMTAWFLSPDLKELKEYFANYKKVNRLQQIDRCKDDIERYKK